MTIQQLTPHLSREDLCDGQIIVFTLSDMSEGTVETWMSACEDIMRQCVEQGRHVLIAQDMSHPAAKVTPYFSERTKTTTSLYPELKGRSAIILSDTPEAHNIIQHTQHNVNQNTRERQFFTSREEAVSWLQEKTLDSC